MKLTKLMKRKALIREYINKTNMKTDEIMILLTMNIIKQMMKQQTIITKKKYKNQQQKNKSIIFKMLNWCLAMMGFILKCDRFRCLLHNGVAEWVYE
jgi:hypothetical protein